MKDAYKPVWLILLVATGLAAVVGIARLRGGADEPERVPWTTDLDAAIARSTAEKKPVLVYFTARWCEPCQRMKSTTWADERVAAALTKYIPVKVDFDDQRSVADRFGVESFPRVEVVGNGTRQLVTDRGVTPEDFLAALARAGGDFGRGG